MTHSPVLFALAEAAAFDMRGNPSLIGLLAPGVTVPAFPAQLAPWLAAIFEQDEDFIGEEPRGSAGVSIQIADEQGNVVFFVQQDVPFASSPYDPSMPHRLQVVAQTPFTVESPGTYRVTVTGRVEAQLLTVTRAIRVRAEAAPGSV